MTNKLLIIEDNSQDRMILSRAMKKAGYENLVFAARGEEGVAKADSESPDLVVTDTVLPDIDGFEVCRRIKASNPNAKIIITTGEIQAVDAAKAQAVGVSDYIVKSVDNVSLLAAIEKLLGAPTKLQTPARDTRTDKLERKVADLQWVSDKTKTGVKELYKKLEQQNRELTELTRQKSYMVSVVSHDFRNPVALIFLAADMMAAKSYEGLNDKQIKCIQSIKAGALRLDDMVARLLNSSSIDAGSVEIRLKETECGALIERVVATLQPMTLEKKLTLDVALPEGLPTVMTDPGCIEQIIINLINNAMKFTPEGGTITVSAKTSGDFLRVSVADTGPGIPKENQKRIFGRFAQLDTAERQRGVGLGLAICTDFIQKHKGRIWVESEVGKGSDFIFEIPLDPFEASSPQGQ